MEFDVVNKQGEKVKTVKVTDSVFALEMNEAVLHQVVKAYRANRRQGTHATKTRSLVSGGGKKPFRQKGTGNARQGSSRSPLMPGGGTAHGPQPRSYTQQINKQVKALALKVALSDKARNKKITVVDDLSMDVFSTKTVVETLKALKAERKTLLSDSTKSSHLYRSARNIYGVNTFDPTLFNAEDVLRHERIVISESALKNLESRLAEKAA